MNRRVIVAATACVCIALAWWLHREDSLSLPPAGGSAPAGSAQGHFDAGASALDPSHPSGAHAVQSRVGASSARDDTVLPAADTPLPGLVARLMDRARHGDAEAAERLYADATRCLDHVQAKRAAREFLMISQFPVGSSTSARLRNVERNSANLATAEAVIAANDTLCRSVDDEYVNEILYDATLHAALAGNEGAAACFVSAPFRHARSFVDDASRQEEYRRYARNFLKRGVDQGDWAMVELSSRVYMSRFEGMDDPVITVGDPDPPQYHALTLLRLLGADDASRHDLEVIARDSAATSGLSARQLEEIQAWAERMYRERFANSPPYDESASFCRETHYDRSPRA